MATSEELSERLSELQTQNEELTRQLHDLQRRTDRDENPPRQLQISDQPVLQPPPPHSPADLPALTEHYDHPAINRVSIKLPPFWKEKPRLWFAQVEAQFALARITSEITKYSYVISHLDERYANEVEDLIINPPSESPYSTLKAEIIRRLCVSEERRIRQLLTEEELGDRTPSQFLRHLRSLVGSSTVQDGLLKTIWMQRLPSHVQGILQAQAGQPGVQTDMLAITADKIFEVYPNVSFSPVPHTTTSVNAVAPPSSEPSTSQFDKLLSQLSVMQIQIKSLRDELNSLRDGRSRSQDRSFSNFPRQKRTSSNSSEPDKLCWYHKHFGQQAKRCLQPCTFKNPTNSRGSQ